MDHNGFGQGFLSIILKIITMNGLLIVLWVHSIYKKILILLIFLLLYIILKFKILVSAYHLNVGNEYRLLFIG